MLNIIIAIITIYIILGVVTQVVSHKATKEIAESSTSFIKCIFDAIVAFLNALSLGGSGSLGRLCAAIKNGIDDFVVESFRGLRGYFVKGLDIFSTKIVEQAKRKKK